MGKRNYGLDLLKIYACFCVVALHAFGTGNYILDYTGIFVKDNILSNIFYYSATCSIPIFFMVNGFLILRKKNLNYNYVLKKIMNIVFIVFLWTGLYSIVDLIVKSGKFSFFYFFFGSFVQKGPFYHFWFLGALCVLLLLAPMLSYLLNRKTFLFILLLIIFIAFSIIISIYSEVRQYPIQSNINQTFRLWTWLLYYLFGGLIAKYEMEINEFIKNKKLKLMIFNITLFTGVLVVVGALLNVRIINNAYAEYNYDNILVIIASVLIFIFCVSSINYSNKQITILQYISPVIMGVYIMHPFVIKIFRIFIRSSNDWNNIVIYILTVLTTIIISRLIIRIPYIKKIISL